MFNCSILISSAIISSAIKTFKKVHLLGLHDNRCFFGIKLFILTVFIGVFNYISSPDWIQTIDIALAESTSVKDAGSAVKESGKHTAQIYKWVDEQGRTFYSSTKQEPKAELAKLPEIKRIKDAPLDQFKEGCKQHGGASCDRGSDADGSVICLDGFRDSPLPFRFACSSAKLALEELSAKGDKQKILVKNGSGVQGKSVAVKVSLSDGNHIFAVGSQTVEPHSLEEFEIPLKDLKLAPGAKLAEKDVQITCANCE